MSEQQLFCGAFGSDKMSPPPSRDASPEQTKKTHSTLLGALNSDEFNMLTANAKLQQEVKMLREYI